METLNVSELVELLRRPTLRVRTGLWLIPSAVLGQEKNESARLGIDAVDLRQQLIARLPQNTEFARLNPHKVLELLDDACQQSAGSECILVYNLDLLLAGLKLQERQQVWRHLFQSFSHRSKALLLCMPQGARDLLPTEEYMQGWRKDQRLAERMF